MLKRFTALLLCLIMVVPMLSACSDKDKKKEKITLMVYMVGSDLEAQHMAASYDMAEMLDSGIDLSRVNLLIYTGGAQKWFADVPNDGNATLMMTEEDGEKTFTQLEKEDENKSMGEPGTLTSFLDYAYENYPAEHYGLIFWDHGSGPLIGFGSDKLFDGDSMDLAELQDAMESSPFSDEKLDFIGFDACLMSSIEVADTLYPYADYMIASQETEPGDGWNYAFLETFGDSFDTEDIGKAIISSFYDYYEEHKKATSNPDLTLACLNLNEIDQVTEAMNGLFNKMKVTLDGGGYQQLAAKRSTMKSFGDAPVSRGRSLDMVDMGALMDECADDYSDEVGALREALDDFIVFNRTNLSSACGVSIYYPYDGSYTYADRGIDVCKTFDESEAYQQFIDDFTRVWSKDWLKADNTVDDRTSAMSGNEIISDENKIVVKLTEDQKKDLSKVYLNIYRKPDADYEFYIPQLYMTELTPDKDGNVIVDADVKVPTINGNLPVSMMQVSKESDRTNYKTISTAVSVSGLPDASVIIYCSVENGSDDIVITTIDDNEGNDADAVRSGKSSLDADKWAKLCSLNWGGTPTRDENGALRQVSEWDTFAGNRYEADIDSTLSLKMQSLSSQSLYKASDYYYQIAISDTKGNYSFSELEQFPAKSVEVKTVEEKTANGVMTFELYDDHAKLIKYEGKDNALIIPEKVSGRPVASIDYGAFTSLSDNKHRLSSLTIENPDIDLSGGHDFRNIKKIILPDGMKSIGSNAFSYFSDGIEIVIPDSVESIGTKAFASGHTLKQLILPRNLRSIGVCAFSGCRFENGISFKGENEYYQIKDDMLLSKDGRILYNYFGNETELIIPEGVEVIEPNVHNSTSGSPLTKIEFPSTLKRIRYSAFVGEAPEELILPDSLEEIGHLAFAGEIFFTDDPIVTKKIYLGKNLKWIGKTILGLGVYDELEVSEDNRFYAVRNNRLTNKAGYSDLSEIALSSSDNLSKNASEYRRYLLATEGVDLSHYIKEDGRKYNKTYIGNDYCLRMKMTDSAMENAAFKCSEDVTVMGKSLKLPCKYAELTALGFSDSEGNYDPLPDTIEAGDTESTIMKNGKCMLIAYLKNPSEKAEKSEDCYVYELSLGSDFNKIEARSIPPFEYMGLSQDSTVADVISALGEPTEIYISGTSWIELTYQVYDEESILSLSADGVKLCFGYDLLSDSAVLLSAEIQNGYDTLKKESEFAAFTESPEQLEAALRNYSLATKGIDLSRYKKRKKRTYNGTDFCEELELKTEEKSAYKGASDFNITGKSFKLESDYSDFPSTGMTANDPPTYIKQHDTDLIQLSKKDPFEEITLTLKNTDDKAKLTNDCIVCKITLGNFLSGINPVSVPEFEYQGVTRDSKISDVIALLGEPNQIYISSFGMTLYYDDESSYDQDRFEYSNSFHLTFTYDPAKKAEVLSNADIKYGY